MMCSRIKCFNNNVCFLWKSCSVWILIRDALKFISSNTSIIKNNEQSNTVTFCVLNLFLFKGEYSFHQWRAFQSVCPRSKHSALAYTFRKNSIWIFSNKNRWNIKDNAWINVNCCTKTRIIRCATVVTQRGWLVQKCVCHWNCGNA